MQSSDNRCKWGFAAGPGVVFSLGLVFFLLAADSGRAGELVLSSETAAIRGNAARIDRGEGRNCIGYWSATHTPIEWQIEVERGAEVSVEVEQACPTENAGARYQVQIGEARLEAVVKATKGWGDFLRVAPGSLALTGPRTYTVRVVPVNLSPSGNVMNLRSVRLSGDGFVARQHLEESPPRTWELVWADEFDGEGLPSPEKWTYESGADIRNNELQHYTKERLENTRVADGHLIIEARKEAFEGSGYTAGSLESVPRWTYGKIEVRARVPIGRGMWPAIWMLPPSIHEVGWPACGEIDIMENVGYDPENVHFSAHTTAYNHTRHNPVTAITETESPWKTFHVYALEWSPDRMTFLMDGTSYLTYWNEGTGRDVWPFDQPFYLKLNLAIGGMWGSVQGIDDSVFPQQFVIDYVRVYRELTEGCEP